MVFHQANDACHFDRESVSLRPVDNLPHSLAEVGIVLKVLLTVRSRLDCLWWCIHGPPIRLRAYVCEAVEPFFRRLAFNRHTVGELPDCAGA